MRCQADQLKPRATNGMPRAFTLAEILLVLILISIAMAAVVFSLREPLRAARRQNATERLIQVDQLARQRASHHGSRGDLLFDLDESQLSVRFTADDSGAGELVCPLHAVTAMRTPGQLRQVGVVRIPLSARGRTESYAIRLSAQGLPDRWLLVSGVTGQPTTLTKEQEVEALLSVETLPRDHAH